VLAIGGHVPPPRMPDKSLEELEATMVAKLLALACC
jgi:hypothetical protein